MATTKKAVTTNKTVVAKKAVKATEVKKDKLIKALKEYDSSLTESDLDRITRYVERKPAAYRTSYNLKYLDDVDLSSLLTPLSKWLNY